MSTKYRFFVLMAGLLASCGQVPTGGGSAVTAVSSSDVQRVAYNGVDANGKVCEGELRFDTDGHLTGASLTGTFIADYKIPAPGSGIYGKQYMPGTFDSAVNIKSGGVSVSGMIFSQGTVLRGSGKPVFWDGETSHKLTVSGTLTAPDSVTYANTTRVFGVVPFVVIDLSCRVSR